MTTLLFDFDSTLIRDEGLDELFRLSLEGREDTAERVAAFQLITDRGMAGEISWEESLGARMALVEAGPDLVDRTARYLVERLSPSVARNRGFFERASSRIHVVSGGFRELITPTATRLGLPPARIHAHRFRYGEGGRIAGFDPSTPLALGGKVEAVARLGLDPAHTWIIGDGATDLELRERGLASVFVAWTENRRRPSVVAAADHEVDSLEGLLALLGRA